ncbi:hypothetical protein Hs30E_20370 [Lactococcus hodotermopsidis]|uniref:DUF1129 domain-containing protein n=1 Tax=Pseudolactococcus hodotermopsidis TaxID=2709157 RepID=A0A6A0BFN9_9LACT|nr:DUF1129 family protein [Lactococcus hodotermopsidis]GFH43525.1 hypothetical protein Hs30E_20370 [Lactococcus hodotermopsidis]
MENYIEQLTAKNSEYVHIITRELVKIGKTDEEIKTILSEILPEIIDAQNRRILAKDLLGTPSEFTARYAPKIAKTDSSGKAIITYDNETPVLMWLDSSLLMLGVLCLMNGIMANMNKNSRTYGIITLLVMSFVAGVIIYLMYRLIYKKQAMGLKVPWPQSIAIMVVAFLVWITLFGATVMLPTTINVVPPRLVVIILGAAALGIRHFLKRRYHIKPALGSLSQPVGK